MSLNDIYGIFGGYSHAKMVLPFLEALSSSCWREVLCASQLDV